VSAIAEYCLSRLFLVVVLGSKRQLAVKGLSALVLSSLFCDGTTLRYLLSYSLTRTQHTQRPVVLLNANNRVFMGRTSCTG